MNATKHGLRWIVVAVCALTMASCSATRPGGGVVSLAQEAMAASAKLAESRPAPPKPTAHAEQAAEAVATWRGSSGDSP